MSHAPVHKRRVYYASADNHNISAKLRKLLVDVLTNACHDKLRVSGTLYTSRLKHNNNDDDALITMPFQLDVQRSVVGAVYYNMRYNN